MNEMNGIYCVPRIEFFSFELEEVITMSTPVTTDKGSGGIEIGTGDGDGHVDFSDIP